MILFLLLFVLVLVPLIIASLSFYCRRMVSEQYEAKCYATGVFENDQEALKQQVLSYYQDRVRLDFPSGTELLYANDDKGTLLESATALSMKLRIKNDNRGSFEEQIILKNNKDFIFRESIWESALEMRGPIAVWKPSKLKQVNKYAWDYDNDCGCVLYIGQEGENTVIYLIYGV